MNTVVETLEGGADVVVTLRNAQARPVAVKVRKLPRAEYASLALVIGDETESGELAEAALYCGRDEAWAAELDDDSLDRVLAEGTRLNFTSFARWFKRRARMPQLLVATETRQLVEASLEVIRTMEQRDSTSGSPARDTENPISASGATRS
ncbi:MAG TPA: hypothetical protein PKA41_17365 [Verrucomicrobiota bacterium]|nr:hypothetical protein [Verrucomicrobiota bacterium]